MTPLEAMKEDAERCNGKMVKDNPRWDQDRPSETWKLISKMEGDFTAAEVADLASTTSSFISRHLAQMNEAGRVVLVKKGSVQFSRAQLTWVGMGKIQQSAMRDYLKKAALQSGMKEAVIAGAGRNADVVRVRDQVVVNLRDAGYSLNQIGRFLNRDHTTILAAERRGRKARQ